MKNLPEDVLQGIASELIQARESQNMTLEEISTKTFIPLRLLKALESAEAFKLPEPIFVQGFIKRYAKLVGLDGEALARRIPLEQPPIATNLVKEPAPRELAPPINRRVSIEELNAPSASSLLSPTLSTPSSTPAWSPAKAPASRPVWLIPALAAIAAIGLIGSAIALVANRPKSIAEVPSAEPSIVPASVKPAASTSPAVKPKPSASPASQPSPSVSVSPSPKPSPIASVSPSPSPSAKPSGPVSVAVNLSDASWVQVVADGEVVFEGEMAKGARQSWSAKKEIEISSGNAGAVTIAHNQKPGQVMGAAGTVETAKFTGP